jgi:ATP-dependent Lhr-like helicase
VGQLQGVAIPASVLERDVLTARVRDYSPRMLDELCAAGEVVWVGAGPIGRDDGKVLLYLRGSPLARVAPVVPMDDRPSGPEHERVRSSLRDRGAAFFRDLAGADDRLTLDALWDLVWAGEVTNDAFAPVRALSQKKRTAGGGRGGRSRPRLGTLTALGPPTSAGRWTLVDRGGVEPTLAAHALAGALLERHGVLTREVVRGEGTPGGFASVYPVLRAMEDAGRIRRGYFVAGLGGAQFALPGAVDRLRQHRDVSSTTESGPAALVLAATDPANPFGIALPWPEVVGDVGGRPSRTAGSYVVLLDGRPSLYVERRAKALIALRPFDGTWEADAVAALDQLLAPGRLSRIVAEKADVELQPHLKGAGFVPTPKGWARYS